MTEKEEELMREQDAGPRALVSFGLYALIIVLTVYLIARCAI